MSKNVRWFPQFAIDAPDNWLPRQSVQYAKLLAQVARDTGATISARTDAISRSARLGAPGKATVDRFLDLEQHPIAAKPRSAPSYGCRIRPRPSRRCWNTPTATGPASPSTP